MMRVLFIDAVDPISELSQRFVPLWPAYLAAYFEAQIGPNRFEFRLSKGKIENEFKSFKPHVAAISSVTMNYSHAIEYARIAKKFGLPVVIGGIHISFMPGSEGCCSRSSGATGSTAACRSRSRVSRSRSWFNGAIAGGT